MTFRVVLLYNMGEQPERFQHYEALDMDWKKISNEISMEHGSEWEFIQKYLDPASIEKIIRRHLDSKYSFSKREFSRAFGINIFDYCRKDLLMEASALMWQNISETQLSNLLFAMKGVGAQNIILEDGISYNIGELLYSWEKYHTQT